MAVTLRIRQEEKAIPAEAGATILDAALAAGLDFPHSCRSGNCAACKCELLSGADDIMELPRSDYALSPEERARGLILACRTMMYGDVEISYLEETPDAHPERILSCSVTSCERPTHDVVVVRLSIDRGGPFTFEAGQFARVTLPNGAAREYSMANGPDDSFLEFHIRRMPGGAASTFAYDRLKAGDAVEIAGPYGNAWWRSRQQGSIIAVAGGTGLAPMKSIVATALRNGATQGIALYVGARDEGDLYGLDDLDDLARRYGNFTFVPVLSHPSAPTVWRTGWVTDAVRADFPRLEGAKLYMAGPPPMVAAGMEVARAIGIDPADVHADPFVTAADRAQMEVQG